MSHDLRVFSAVGAGKLRRVSRLLRPDGRGVFIAMDHPAYLGAGVSASAVASVAQASPDAVLATWQLARSKAGLLADCGLILRVDGGIADMGDPRHSDESDLLYRAEEAMALGADAVVIMVFPGSPDEGLSLNRLARLSAECELLGLPVMAESIPGGWAQHVPWTTENVAKGARISVELGADIVKTLCPGSTEEFNLIADSCPAPVVVLGGPKSDREDDVVELAQGVVKAGAAGVAVGRNVWGSDDPGGLVQRLMGAVHGDR